MLSLRHVTRLSIGSWERGRTEQARPNNRALIRRYARLAVPRRGIVVAHIIDQSALQLSPLPPL